MLETSTIHSWVTKYIHFWLTLEVPLLVTIHYILRRHDLLNNTRQTLLSMSPEYTVLQYQLPPRLYIVLALHNTSALCICYYRQPEAIIYHQSRLYIIYQKHSHVQITSSRGDLLLSIHVLTTNQRCIPWIIVCILEARIYSKHSAKPFGHG